MSYHERAKLRRLSRLSFRAMVALGVLALALALSTLDAGPRLALAAAALATVAGCLGLDARQRADRGMW